MSSNSTNQVDAEAQFRAQASVLAAALRRADEAAPTTAMTTPRDTYRQLCFDDPVVTAADCQALAKALVEADHYNGGASLTKTRTTPLALSNRLVDGVAHVCQRQVLTHNNSSNNSKDETPTTVSGTASAEAATTNLLTPPAPESSVNAGGYATLAWTVYGHLPLLILFSNHLAEASTWMGSFRAPENVAAASLSLQNDEPYDKREKAAADTSQPLPDAPNDNDHDKDSLQEVWAAESDPSDYDYGTEPSPTERLAGLQAWTIHDNFTVEPDELSQPKPDTTWLHVADSVTFLLQRLKYSTVLAGISISTWNKAQIAAKLTQCTLALLMPFTLQSTPLLSQYPDSHWQQLALQPLHAFRDAVEEHSAALLDDYLNLLVLMLQAHHASSASSMTTSSVSNSTKIAPATLVGLGALATVCHASLEKGNAVQIKSVRETILRVADDLSTILEMAVVDDPVVPWTFLSLWQVLSSSQPHQGLTNVQAQILLQSGLVRQWMLTWQQQQQKSQGGDNGSNKNPLQTEMERSILYLVCAAPTTVGKYVWRFACFAGTATTTAASSSGDDVFLWNLVGGHLAEFAGDGSLVSLKKSSSVAARPAPTASICRQQAVETFQSQCQAIVQTLSSWKDRRSQQPDSGEEQGAEIEEDTKQVMGSFHAIVNALSLPLVHKLFLEKFVATEGFDMVDTLAPILKLLVSWPSPKSHEDTKENHSTDEAPEVSTSVDKGEKPTENDDEDAARSNKRRRGRVEVEDEMVATLRKSIKILRSTLESPVLSSTGRFSSKAD